MYPILTLGDKVSVILAICDIKEENQGDLELAKVKCKAEKSNTKARRGSILFVTHNFEGITVITGSQYWVIVTWMTIKRRGIHSMTSNLC